MHVLVTRPEADSAAMARELSRMGHRVSVCPMLTTEPCAPSTLPLEGVQALVATSRNALRALSAVPELTPARRLPMIAVGPATGAAARELGFGSVIEGTGGADDLAPVVRRALDPSKGALLHVAGDKLAGDLAGALAGDSFTVRQLVVYRTRPLDRLPDAIVAALASCEIDAVILMSPQTATVFARLVAAAGISGSVASINLLCLSDAVAAALAPLAPVRVTIAERPALQEILALVTRIASDSG